MRVEVDRKLLETASNYAFLIVKDFRVLPVVYLIASGDKLTVKAMNNTAFFSFTIQADIKEEGMVVLNAKKFKDVVQVLEGRYTYLKLEEALLIHDYNNKSKFKLLTVSEDLPEFPEPKIEEHLNTNTLSGFIKDLEPFVLREKEGLSVLSCIYFDKTNIVASDGHRLAFFPHRFNISFPILVPYTLFKILTNLFHEFFEVSVGSDDRFTHFTGESENGKFVLSIRKVEGEYPDYLSVIPENFNTKLTVSVPSFYDAVERVSSVGSLKTMALALHITSDAIEIRVQDPEFGEAETLVEVEDFLGKEFVIGFNSQYLLEILNLFRKHSLDTVEISFVDNESPVVFKSGDITCVLMPMRL